MATVASCRLAGGRGADATRPLLPLALARWTWAAQKKSTVGRCRATTACTLLTTQRNDGSTRPHAAETRAIATRAACA